MTKQYTLSTTLILAAFALMFFNGKLAPDIFSTKTGKVYFISNAQLETIEAENDRVKAILNRNDKTVAFEVPIDAFVGFNSDLQHKHFEENYMEIDDFPSSTFKGKIIEDVDLTKDGVYKVRAKGFLDIHGETMERVVPGEISVNADRVTIKANFDIVLDDHGIKTPRIVNQKIAESVKVQVDVSLTKGV